MIEAETPAKGIMKTSESPWSEAFHIACDCHSQDHAVDIWIEVSPDSGPPQPTQLVQVEFFVNMTVPFWTRGFNRFQAAWDALWHGQVTHGHTLLLNKQAALNLSEALRKSIHKLEA